MADADARQRLLPLLRQLRGIRGVREVGKAGMARAADPGACGPAWFPQCRRAPQ